MGFWYTAMDYGAVMTNWYKGIRQDIIRGMRGESASLLLANPLVHYNMRHVIRIETTPVAPEIEEWKRRQETESRRAGFRPQTGGIDGE